MTEIYSKIEPEKLLHFIVRKEDIIAGRFDVICDSQFLQLAVMNMDEGKTFKPHRHKWRDNPPTVITQEAWVCISGKVQVTYYDTEGDKVIGSEILNPGDCTTTLFGGHTYEAMEDDTRVYEFKVGRYYGQEIDKEFI